MQVPLKSTTLGRFDWRRSIFSGWVFALIFFLIFLFMPQVFADLVAQVFAPVFPTLDGNQLLGVLSSAGIYVLMALGLNVVVGFAGLLDLGYAAFFAIGAYSYAVVNFRNAVPAWPLFLAAPVVAAMFGVMLGAPTLRLRGDYLAIVTLGFGEIVPIVFRNLPVLGGVNGFVVTAPTPLVYPFGTYTFDVATADPSDLTNFYYLVFGLVVIATIGVTLLRTSRIGRAWVAIREDETAAACSGVNLVATKLIAFAIGASVSGFAGVLYGAQNHIVSPDQFGFAVSITILVMIVLGGMGSIPGVIVGALIISLLNRLLAILPPAIQNPESVLHFLQNKAPNLAADINNSEFLIFGALLLLMVILRPQGLIPSAIRKRELKGEALAVVPGSGGKLVEVPVGTAETEQALEELQELEVEQSEIISAPDTLLGEEARQSPPGSGVNPGGNA
jgi:ABC-type branched-subunit amino acid transport system permease subunit